MKFDNEAYDQLFHPVQETVPDKRIISEPAQATESAVEDQPDQTDQQEYTGAGDPPDQDDAAVDNGGE